MRSRIRSASWCESASRTAGACSPEASVEQEYQKRLHLHHIAIRPDIIIHVPTPQGGNRGIGNSIVFELKRKAGPTRAQEDFGSLDTIIDALDYPLGVFVNIDSGRTQGAQYHGPYRDRIHFFAVRLVNATVQVRHAYYTADGLVEG